MEKIICHYCNMEINRTPESFNKGFTVLYPDGSKYDFCTHDHFRKFMDIIDGLLNMKI